MNALSLKNPAVILEHISHHSHCPLNVRLYIPPLSSTQVKVACHGITTTFSETSISRSRSKSDPELSNFNILSSATTTSVTFITGVP
ncbi:predicted protein [Sclerotinia sclerotiorum 1980 UF-70]|uniref:Uncharacterized protein n=1 Tax=Sclerotinia sclerotiorum (strain ATCC 18683 / 1980 / Ss-1) TaxID=665079 RepID=A7F8N1_SCLS1|nr:predicted protein [Sclerotinia sclerotiorum 1980 UF-70]EDN99102.1 predicted protein [Sclerotinia sclerotiorum 1980 UF-70]